MPPDKGAGGSESAVQTFNYWNLVINVVS